MAGVLYPLDSACSPADVTVLKVQVDSKCQPSAENEAQSYCPACNFGWINADQCQNDDIFSCCCPQTDAGYDFTHRNCPLPYNDGIQWRDCATLGGIDACSLVINNQAACNGPSGGQSGAGVCPATCYYPAEAFTTTQQLQAFATAYTINTTNPINLAIYNEQLLPTFCLQQVTTCPPYPNSDGVFSVPEKCARVVSTNPADSTICQQWATNTQFEATVQAAMSGYCAQFLTSAGPTQPECDCIERSFIDLYRIIGQNNNFLDACWWLPCKNANQYLVPPQYINAVEAGNCPSRICQQVVEIVGNTSSNINVNVASEFITCPGISNGGTSGSNNFLDFIERNWVAALVVAGVVVVIIIVVIFLLVRKKKK